MGLIARKATTAVPPNDPPEWTSTPNPTWLDGVGGTYDLTNDVFDPEDDTLTFVKTAGNWPANVSMDSAGLITATDLVVEGTTAGITVTVDDGTNSPVASSSFSVVINAAQALAAFPGAEGFGTETIHGRGGIVAQVTNLNDSGAGSLRAALALEVPRIIIFRISGTIYAESRMILGGEHSFCGVFGQTAPGGGICIAASATLGHPMVQISALNDSDGLTTAQAHDIVFQHIRFRHGSRNRETIPNNDCFDAHAGTYNLILDHCSISWASDENLTFWHHNSDDLGITDIHDITVSHCIIAEGDDVHNTGHLVSGGAGADDVFWNLTYHHNLGAHLGYRDVSWSTGSGDSTKGAQAINNIHYDSLQHHAFGQTQYTNNQLFFDCINEVNIRSSRENATGNRKFNVSRIYTLTGFEWQTPVAFDHGKVRRPPPDDPQSAGVWWPPSLYVTGSIQRETDLSDTTPSSASAEADNTEWIVHQYDGLTGGGGPYDTGETHEERGSPLTTQPTNPVTTTSALQAHTDLIVNGDVGALPHDSVDARIVASVQNGTVYDRYNVPGYPGSSATWPTLADTGAPTDTSGNGLPDSYQVGELGKDINDAYNPANTFTVGNGYSDIENWIHDLSLGASLFVATTGSDSNAGTISAPWLTIQYAVDNASPGDTIYVRGGTYNERITIGVSGTIGNYITLTNYLSEAAILGGSGIGNGTMITGVDISYYKIIGLEISNYTGGGIRFWADGSHIEIRNNWFHDQAHEGPEAHVIEMLAAQFGEWGTSDYATGSITDVIIDGNTIGPDIVTGTPGIFGEALTLTFNVKRFQVTNNVIDDTSHIAMDVIGKEAWVSGGAPPAPAPAFPQYGLISGNTIKNSGFFSSLTNSMFHVDGCKDVVYEDNLVHDCAGHGIDCNAEDDAFTNERVIYRRNRILRTDPSGIFWGSSSGQSDNIRWAHNSVFLNYTLDARWGLAGGGGDDIQLMNNIIHVTDGDDSGFGINHYRLTASTPILDYNLYRYSTSNFKYQGTTEFGATAFADYQTASSQDVHSLTGDPLYVDPATNDLTPDTGSPAINAGWPLTTTNGSGSSSKTLIVDDSYWFHDGMGIEGLIGDTIQVGAVEVVIESIDYATHTITLATAISWNDADGVSYPFNGALPDIGAVET